MSNEAKNSGFDNEQENREPANENKGGSVFSRMREKKEAKKTVEMSPTEWLELCKTDSGAYEPFDKRILKAFGEPNIVDTSTSSQQERLVYGGKKIARYEPFNDLYDAEDTISDVVTFLENDAKGMLVLRGPVGSGKTEIATITEKEIEKVPFYLLQCKVTGVISPFNDSPLCLLADDELKDVATKEYGIPERYIKDQTASPWVTKRLDHHDNDVEAAFNVVKVYPSRERQLGVVKLDPQDPKTADLNALIGSVDMTKIGDECPLDSSKTMSAGDPDAYIPGALSRSNGGVLHIGEGFRNNPALMNTFLEGVTTGYFAGKGGIGTLPMNQFIIITSNDPVWKEFKSKNDSDAARNRIEVIDVPYTLRMSEELKIYEKLLNKSSHAEKPVAPKTMDLLAEFSVVTRLMDGKDNALSEYDPHVRAKVLNGEIPDGGKVPKMHELRAKASPDEGLYGFTVRDAERVLKRTFMARAKEGIQEADTILLLETLREFVNKANVEDISNEDKSVYMNYINRLAERNREELEKKINAAIIDADDSTCQRIFDEYLDYADAWLADKDLFSDSGEPIDHKKIEKHLESFEKRAGIQSGQTFRRNAVASINSEIARIARKNAGKPADQQEDVMVRWDSYEPVAKAIRKQFEIDQDSRRHILKAKSDTDLRSEEEKRQYSRFHENMEEQGYTDTMVSRMLHHLSYT